MVAETGSAFPKLEPCLLDLAPENLTAMNVAKSEGELANTV
jgi:hypothetical protein